MPQWQFKLFEYDIREELKTDNIDYVAGCDQKKFIIQMFGMDEYGKTVCIFVASNKSNPRTTCVIFCSASSATQAK